MRTINYMEGVAQFQIPKDWIEEYEDEGAVNFYEDAEEAGNLRFNIITFSPPPGMEDATMEDFLKASGIPEDAEKIHIDKKNLIAKHQDVEEVEDLKLRVYYFEYVHQNSEGSFDLGMFAWTIEDTWKDEPKYKEQLAMIENSARELKFGT